MYAKATSVIQKSHLSEMFFPNHHEPDFIKKHWKDAEKYWTEDRIEKMEIFCHAVLKNKS